MFAVNRIAMKFLQFFILLFLASVNSNAQTAWEREYFDIYITDAVLSHDGGLIVGGWTEPKDMALMKLDADGLIQWQTRFDKNNNQFGTSVAALSGEGYALAGRSGGSDSESWVLRVDEQGNLLWQRSLNHSAYKEEPHDLAPTSDDGMVITGYYDDPLSGERLFIMKLNSSGDVEWEKSSNQNSNFVEKGYEVEQTSDGGYIVIGTVQAPNVNDLWILKLDGIGNIQWQKTISLPNFGASDIPPTIQETTDDGFILSATTYDVPGFEDILLWKLNATGDIQWQKKIGSGNSEETNDIQQAADGGFLLVGFGGFVGVGTGDLFLKLDSSGNILWKATIFDRYDFNHFSSVTELSDGSSVFTGGFDINGGAISGLVLKFDVNGESCLYPWDFVLDIVDANYVASDSTLLLENTSITPTAPQSAQMNTSFYYSEICSLPSDTCLFCDEFNDGILATDWTYHGNWTESGNQLYALEGARKNEAVATPAFSGCSVCTIEASMVTPGSEFGKVWLVGWNLGRDERVELLMKEGVDKWILRQRFNGVIVAKQKASWTILPNRSYFVRVSFDGSVFRFYLGGNLLITLPAASTPTGSAGFGTKRTTASFGFIHVE
jgi:hypothetical protein